MHYNIVFTNDLIIHFENLIVNKYKLFSAVSTYLQVNYSFVGDFALYISRYFVDNVVKYFGELNKRM